MTEEIKSKLASDLDREETTILMGWCDCQREDLWSGMKLQDILNVYHVSSEWLTWEGWAEDEGDIARKAWNSVVGDAGQHMILHGEDEPESIEDDGSCDPLFGQRMDSADAVEN